MNSSSIASRSSKWDGLLDWCQMLTGVGLSLFILVHMTLESGVLIGPGLTNTIAEFLESTGMVQAGGPIIFLIFMFHFLLAVRKVPSRFEGLKTIFSHARTMRHSDTWMWLIQVVSALAILLMGTIHMWMALTDLPINAAKSAERIQGGFWMVFYLILLPMVILHVGVGVYRIGVKWGFIKDSTRKKFLRGMDIFILAYICLGVATLLRYWFLTQ